MDGRVGLREQAQWYGNLLATPQVHIEVGHRRLAVTARPLDAQEGGEAMARYAADHPRTARRLATFMGFDVDGSLEDHRALGRAIPFMCFVPRPG